MKSRFETHIRTENIFVKNETVLLAISGGVDSVVLFHLLLDQDVKLTCAHVNYQLRGSESDQDEKFVNELCEKKNIPLKIIKCDTNEIAKNEKLGIQEVARKLRYEWFEKLSNEHGFTKVITAHHADDSIETFFINLIRGTGLNGLTGIKKMHGKICRPLLFATKDDVRNYAKENNITFRQDASNSQNKYLRNNLRNNIIPLIETVAPSFQKTMHGNIERLKISQGIVSESVLKMREKYTREEADKFLISKVILEEKGASLFLFEFLKDYGFNQSQINDISENSQVGKTYFSEGNILTIERENFCVKVDKNLDSRTYYVDSNLQTDHLPFSVKIESIENEKISLKTEKNIGLFDFNSIQFPLTVRLWKDGDKFKPFGMNGKKLISDYLTQQKVSAAAKRQQWLVVSGDEVMWVAGHRTSDSFKITDKTKRILRIELSDG